MHVLAPETFFENAKLNEKKLTIKMALTGPNVKLVCSDPFRASKYVSVHVSIKYLEFYFVVN